jgi:putative Mg2+ transporter-C (MgtC) family protein
MIDIDHITLRLLLACLFGGIIGFERELHGRAAGLRTTILVGVGSCLLMVTSMNLQAIYHGITDVDPGRIAAQVVSGIGFLGAGTIMRFGASIRGLTTAAGLWAVAGIGLATGAGFYQAAFMTTAIIFIVLVALSRFERGIKRTLVRSLNIELNGGVEIFSEISAVVSAYAENQSFEIIPAKNGFKLTLHICLHHARLTNDISQGLLKINGITSVKWA